MPYRTLRRWIDKPWVQLLLLAVLAAAAIYYWGWVFHFGYKFDWSVLYTLNPTYHQNFGLELLAGLRLTVKITLVSSAIALALGTLAGLARLSHFRPVYWLATTYVEFFRNTPLLVQLFFWYFAFPMALPDDVRTWVFNHNFEFWSATLGLSVYTGAFMAEVIRAGLQSIPKGLLEAAYSSGLGYFQALRTIILPLAFRAIIPPLGSEFLNNMKNSSLAMVVGVAELCWQSQQVESLTFKGFEATTAATLLYLAMSLIISAVLNMVNLRLQVVRPEHRGLGYRLGGPFLRAPGGGRPQRGRPRLPRRNPLLPGRGRHLAALLRTVGRQAHPPLLAAARRRQAGLTPDAARPAPDRPGTLCENPPGRLRASA